MSKEKAHFPTEIDSSMSDQEPVTLQGVGTFPSAESAKEAIVPAPVTELPEREADWSIHPDHHLGGEAA